MFQSVEHFLVLLGFGTIGRNGNGIPSGSFDFLDGFMS